MTAIDRRRILIGLVCGMAIATAAALVPHAASSAPLAISKSDFVRPNALIREARVTVTVGPRRHHRHRHRHWRCWWHRGRHVCGWRHW
jgi:hypothetical protein